MMVSDDDEYGEHDECGADDEDGDNNVDDSDAIYIWGHGDTYDYDAG